MSEPELQNRGLEGGQLQGGKHPNSVTDTQVWNDFWRETGSLWALGHPEVLRELTKVTPISGLRILEVGIGSGADSVALALGGGSVVGLDLSAEGLVVARQVARDHTASVELVQGDARNLPFDDCVFDLVFSQGFLEHFPDPGLLLREQVRVLKGGGYLLVDVPQKYSLYTLRKHRQMEQGTWPFGWETEYSPSELEKMVQRVGLHIVSMYGWGYDEGAIDWKLRRPNYWLRRHFGRPLIPERIERWYLAVWEKFDRSWLMQSRLVLYLRVCVGIIAQKPRH